MQHGMKSQPSILLTTLNAKYIHLNLAIRLLYELHKQDPRLSWKEFTIKETDSQIAAYCGSYDVVCFSCYIWNITPTLAAARRIKAAYPEIQILLGGPEVSYDWEPVIRLPYVDYIITGEGETPFSQFLQAYPDATKLLTIPNLISKIGGDIQYHEYHEPFNLELYQHTNPYQHDDPATLYNRVVYVETSRGCPYKCAFCLASLDNRVRMLPEAHIQSNLDYLLRHGRVIKFLDRTFNLKKEVTLRMFQYLVDHAGPHHVFQFEITADILHPDIIQFIREKVPRGLFRFEIGIQSVNEKANLAVSRRQQFEKTRQVILQVRDYVELHLDLIIGLPHDYRDDIKRSFEEVFRLFAPELQLGFLKFLKGTPVRKNVEEHGYVFHEQAPYQIIRSHYLSEAELGELEKLEQVLEIYWNKKRLPRCLRYITQKYSIFDYLLHLGDFFSKRSSFIRHSLDDIFTIARDYHEAFYPEDPMLHELFTLDYYTYSKTKPADRFPVPLNRKEQLSLAEAWKLPHRKFRYTIIPISFDYDTYMADDHILPNPQWVIFEYNGISKPKIFTRDHTPHPATA